MGYDGCEPREGSWTDYVSYGKLTHASEELINKTGSDMLGITYLAAIYI